LSKLEEGMGDFSPPMGFPEEMSGHVSTIGLGDNVVHHDPYRVAAQGPPNFRLAADISAKRIRDILDPDGSHGTLNGTAHWTDPTTGVETTYAMTGTFKFLIMNEHEIECWNMVYEGTMTPRDGAGRALRFRGMKALQLREGSHWWTDLTDLAVDLYVADGVIPTYAPIAHDAMVARGIIAVSFEGVVTQANKLEIAYGTETLKAGLLDAYRRIESIVKEGLPEEVPTATEDLNWRGDAMLGGLLAAQKKAPAQEIPEAFAKAYAAKALGKMGALTMRTYGRFLSYMANFPAQADRETPQTGVPLPEPQIYVPKVPGKAKHETLDLRLTRYQGGTKGPVLVAAGFGAIASTFATPTVEKNLVQALVEDDFDVWLFDYRGSGDLPASLTEFDMDDVATQDFPAALKLILQERTDCDDVQVVVHCVGSLLFFMSMLAKTVEESTTPMVRSVISSQLGPHTIINWFKYAQADAHVAEHFIDGLPKSTWPLIDMMKLDEPIAKVLKEGLDVVDPCSKGEEVADPDKMSLNQMIDGLIWDVPNFAPTVCNSPTCHRINFFFGPTYQHEQLNQATHNAIMDMFGKMSPAPFPQIARCFAEGHAVSNSQDIDYMQDPGRLTMPIHFIVGAKNPLMVPECSLRTIDWLRKNHKHFEYRYTRTVYQGYGHIDCFIGRDAWKDIFPDIVAKLNETHDPKLGVGGATGG
ncbi:MAG: hypothetical protein AAFP98_12170, partial [Pseudomonadota bacterium]